MDRFERDYRSGIMFGFYALVTGMLCGWAGACFELASVLGFMVGLWFGVHKWFELNEKVR